MGTNTVINNGISLSTVAAIIYPTTEGVDITEHTIAPDKFLHPTPREMKRVMLG